MIRFTRSAAFLAVITLFSTGCFEDLTGPYDGPSQVEFAQVGGGYSTAVAAGTGDITLRVNLIGPQVGTPITVGVTASGTAVEGRDFTFPNGAEVTIPANSSFGDLTLNIPTGTVAAGASQTIDLELTQSADGSVEGADNLDDFRITIRG